MQPRRAGRGQAHLAVSDQNGGLRRRLGTPAWEQGSEEPGLRSSKRVPYGADSCYWAVAEEYKEAADGLLVEIKSRCGKLAWNWRGGLRDSEDVQKAFQSLHKEAELERVYGLSGEQWPEPILQAVHLLHEHPADEWSAAELAQQVGLSRSHFSILFKKTVGDSFIAFQYKRKLRLAYGLLRETSLTMQEIAEKTGLGTANISANGSSAARVRRQANTVPNKRGIIVNK